MGIHVIGEVKKSAVGNLRRGETFKHDGGFYLVTSDGPFQLTDGYPFDGDLDTEVETILIVLTEVS